MEYILTLIEGFISFISPCVLPLIPLYVSYFAGAESKKSKAFRNALFFVLGFTLIFVILAIISNTIGITLVKYIKYIKIIFAILIIILGLNYLEIFKLNLFSNNKKFNIDLNNLNCFRSFIFGVLFSISATPCVGTFLSSALLLIATQDTLLKGMILILLYCLGLGIPFILSSLLIDKSKNVFVFIKNHFKIIKIISGIILIISGIYLLFKGVY